VKIRAASTTLIAALAVGSPAAAQLVPVSRCQAAIPCSIPFGLRPVDSVAGSPYAHAGNAAISVSAGVEEGLRPKIDRPRVSEDPVEFAARVFVRRNPLPPPRPTPAPRSR
jgi:hypothetical protein